MVMITVGSAVTLRLRNPIALTHDGPHGRSGREAQVLAINPDRPRPYDVQVTRGGWRLDCDESELELRELADPGEA